MLGLLKNRRQNTIQVDEETVNFITISGEQVITQNIFQNGFVLFSYSIPIYIRVIQKYVFFENQMGYIFGVNLLEKKNHFASFFFLI